MFGETALLRAKERLVEAFGPARDADFALIEWVSLTLGDSRIDSLEALVATPQALWDLAFRAGIPLDKTVPRPKQNLRLWVEGMADVWHKKWNAGLYDLFLPAHRLEIVGDFEFRRNYEEVVYSHPQMVLATLLASLVLTTLLLHPSRDSSIFSSICSLSADAQMALADVFSRLETVAQDLAEHAMVDLSLTRTKSVRDIGDGMKLMEQIAERDDTIRGLKEVNASLSARISELEGALRDQDARVQQLSHSKADLVNRFRSCSLVFETEEIRAKDEQIEELRRLIYGKEQVYKRSVLDFEKTQEELYKKLQILENFRSKYAHVAEKEARLAELQERFQAILSENGQLKERLDEAKRKVRETARENELLRARSEVFDRASAGQIVADIKSQLSVDSRPDKGAREAFERGRELLADFLEEVTVIFQPDKPVLREMKENAADNANANGNAKLGGKVECRLEAKETATKLRGATLRFNEKFGALLAALAESAERLTQRCADAESTKAKSKARIMALEDQTRELKAALVQNLKLADPRIQALAESFKAPENFKETSKSLLNAVLARELEIANLKQARRAALSEFMNVEARYAEQVKMLYGLSVAHLTQTCTVCEH